MKQLEIIIRNLAAIDIATIGEESTTTKIRNIILDARVAADKLGPQMRSSHEAEKSDDYQGVSQIAIALGYDGKIHTTRRTDCPDHALIPLMGALSHELRKIARESAKTLGMSQEDYDGAVASIASLILKGEFDAAAQDFSDDSRTNQSPKLVIPRK